MATNTLRPTYLRTGISGQVATSDVATVPTTGTSIQNNQTVYEWMDNSSQWKTNPPFYKGSAGSMPDSLHMAGSEERPRILRGFIRRAQYSLNDDASMSRLYFMYNPENISRDYVNYLDQGALDPFNTVFQSGNLVAPPSVLNFSFEIFFDRQEEAMVAGNRGVMVDMDFFDLVVRNVKPGGTLGANNALPDNGVMMVNPRDITVVFSPEITVQGRPLNASVTYERFTHKMVPTRMRINLQMRVVYFGPQREITTFVPETVRALESIPFPITNPEPYNFSYTAITFEASNEGAGSDSPAPSSDALADALSLEGLGLNGELQDITVPAGPEAPYMRLNMEAMSHGWDRAMQEQDSFTDIDGTGTRNKLAYGGIPHRTELWRFCDCSSFIWAAYAELGLSESLGWAKWDNPKPNGSLKGDWNSVVAGLPASGNIPDTSYMISKFSSNDTICRRLWGWSTPHHTGQYQLIINHCASGDLLFRRKSGSTKGHVGFVWEIKSNGDIIMMHAGSESRDIYKNTITSGSSITYDCAVRPFPKRS